MIYEEYLGRQDSKYVLLHDNDNNGLHIIEFGLNVLIYESFSDAASIFGIHDHEPQNVIRTNQEILSKLIDANIYEFHTAEMFVEEYSNQLKLAINGN